MKGVRGKKNNTPKKHEKERKKKFELVRVEYVDHVIFKNTDSTLVEPSVRETVGWIYGEDEESVLIFHDQSLNRLPNEFLSPESGILLFKSAILGIWDLTSQSLRSRKSK